MHHSLSAVSRPAAWSRVVPQSHGRPSRTIFEPQLTFTLLAPAQVQARVLSITAAARGCRRNGESGRRGLSGRHDIRIGLSTHDYVVWAKP